MVDEAKIDAIKKGRPFKKIDLLIVGVVLAAALVAMIISYLGRGSAAYVQVVYKGSEAYYELSKDRVIRLEEHFVIRVRGGNVWVEESDCKNQVCVRTGKIGYGNQIIVCSPKDIYIRIVGKAGEGLIQTG